MKKAFIQTFIKERLKYVIIGLIILAFFYAFSFAVKEDLFTRFDFDMTVRVQHNIPIRIDPFLSWFSLFGSFEVTLVMLILFVGIQFLRKNYLSIMLIPMFGIMHVVEIVGKSFLDHPGTPFMFHRYALDIIFPSSYVQPGGSYPSGHAMRTTYLVILFAFALWKSKLHRNIKIAGSAIFVTFWIIMVISRVSLGEHWTTDVIGGSLLGAAFALMSFVFL